MKKLLFVLLLGVTWQAQAITVTDSGDMFAFGGLDWTAGFYDGGTFIQTPPAGGTGDITTDDAQAVTLQTATGPAWAQMITQVGPNGGFIEFAWELLAGSDVFYILNGAFFNVPGSSGAFDPFGISVAANDMFGLAVFSQQDVNNVLQITQFSYLAGAPQPGAIPLPPAFLLFGAALAGLGFVRRKKQAAV